MRAIMKAVFSNHISKVSNIWLLRGGGGLDMGDLIWVIFFPQVSGDRISFRDI